MDQQFEPYIENALRWAKEQVDSEAYSFRCLAFVEDAYEISNGIEIFGGSSAKESAEAYGTQTRPLIPPRGTFVFYDCFGSLFETYQNWGHVGLALGNGQVIHAWNKVRLDHYLAVEQLAAALSWTQPRYLGWTPVERIFLGYRQKSQCVLRVLGFEAAEVLRYLNAWHQKRGHDSASRPVGDGWPESGWQATVVEEFS